MPWDVAQKLDNDLGKIIHITADGSPAPGNPFVGQPEALPEIWAYGLRNPEGLAFDPKTGELWSTDIGPEGGDEINIIKKGANYGWPVITYGIEYTKAVYPIGDNGIRVGNGYTRKDGMEQPVYYWDPSFTPSGLTFYQGDLFPQWKNSLLSGALSGKALDRLEIRGDKVANEEALLTDMNTRIRDVRSGLQIEPGLEKRCEAVRHLHRHMKLVVVRVDAVFGCPRPARDEVRVELQHRVSRLHGLVGVHLDFVQVLGGNRPWGRGGAHHENHQGGCSSRQRTTKITRITTKTTKITKKTTKIAKTTKSGNTANAA